MTDPQGTGSRIGVLDVDTGTVKIVTDDMTGMRQDWIFGFEHPSWSPDGRRLAFDGAVLSADAVCKEASEQLPETSMFCFRSYIFVLDLESGAVEQLTDALGVDMDPAWAPDGSAIAFVRFPYPTVETPDPDPQMLLVDPTGGSVQTLEPAGQIYGDDLSWSPDGDRLLLHDGAGAIDVLDLGSMRVTRLVTATISGQELGDPAWSPDGKSVVFTRLVDEGERVFMINAEGGPEKQLAFGCCASWAAGFASS